MAVLRAAIIENGVVVNVVEAEESFAQAQGWIINPNVNRGDIYSNGTFMPPEPDPEPVPASISIRKFWQQLYLDGVTEDHAIATVEAQLPNPQRALVLIDLKKSQIVLRDRPALVQLAPLLGYDTPEKMDEFFRKADRLE